MDEQNNNNHSPVMATAGAAVQDVFLSGRIFTPHYEEGEWQEEFKIGEKYEVEGITFSTGGGATNAAVTFSRQGLRAKFLGKVGNDPAGDAVLADLNNEQVDTSNVKRTSDINTGYSVLLLSPDGGRTVLTYRGASASFEPEDFNLEALNSVDWLYVSSLAGNMHVLKLLLESAKQRGVRVAINPGKGELNQADELRQMLNLVDVLTLNKEETQRLLGEDGDIEQLVRRASELVNIVVVTDGPNGVVATDRNKIVVAGMYEDVPVIDRTGAGDAFGSGLVASLAKGSDLAGAVHFASANSTSVVSQIGAKAGILHEGAELHEMPMEVKDF